MAYINKNVSTMAMPSGMNRMGQFPLDMSSVYYNKAELEAYAASGAIAYVGQIVSLVDETNKKVTVYSIQNTEGLLKEVGTIPLGDGSTIEVSSNGVVSLLGSADAEAGKLPMLEMVKVVDDEGEPVIDEETGLQKEEKKLVWKTLEQIGAGDGNDNTTYAFSYDKDTQKMTITPSFNGVAQTAQVIDLSDFLIASELPEDKNTTYSLTQEGMVLTLTPSEGDADTVTIDAYNKKEIDDKFAALPEDKDTTYSVAEGEKVLKLDGTAFSTVLKLDYSDTKIKLLGKDDALVSEIDASAFVADGVLNDVDYDAENDKLIFTWNIIESTDDDGTIHYKTVEVDVKDLVDVYTAGNGLELTENAFAVKLAEGNESFLTADANGVKLSGVQSAINTAKQEAIDAAAEAAKKYDSKADASSVYTKDEINGFLDDKADSADVYTKTEADNLLNAKANSADVYTKTETDNLLNAKANSADVESTYATKEALKATDDVAKDAQSRVDIVEGKIDEITSVGGEPNVVEKIKVNGVTLEVEKDAEGKSTKSVNIVMPTKVSDLEDDKTYDSRITAAQAKADEGVAAAGTAQAAAEAAQNKADVADGKAVKNAEDIKALQDADTTANGKIQALETTVNNEVSGVAANYAAVVKNASDISTLSATVGTHTTDIADLKTATGNNATEITGLKSAIGNVYTKTETDAKFVAKEDGKSLISTAEIERLANVTNYNDTEIRGLINNNATAINDITKTDGAIDTAIKALTEGAVAENAAAIKTLNETTIPAINKTIADEIDRAKAAEKVNGDAIAILIGDVEGDNTKSARAIAKEEVALIVGAAPEAMDTLEEVAAWIANDETGAAALAAGVKANADAILAINNETTGIAATAKAYTDEEIAKLVKADFDNLAAAKSYSDANLVAAKNYSDANLATAKGYSDTNLATAKKYADDSIAALLVKNVDNKTLQLDENGVASIKAVSTDLLAQGENELIFCAGNASGYIAK